MQRKEECIIASVTQRIKQIKQPIGGYINPSWFTATIRNDGKLLHEVENIHPSIVGLAVDYLTRFMLTHKEQEECGNTGGTMERLVFHIARIGASFATADPRLKDPAGYCERWIDEVKGLDDSSIIAACKLSGFDGYYRGGLAQMLKSKTPHEINPDKDTIENIRTMVERSLSFFKDYGPVTALGFTMLGGYTSVVNTGDGDYLTEDTLWDFKVSKSDTITKYHTLQLAMYWIMGQHSIEPVFTEPEESASEYSHQQIGIFNPRHNKVFILKINDIPLDYLYAIEKDVICYPEDQCLFRPHRLKSRRDLNQSSTDPHIGYLDSKYGA